MVERYVANQQKDHLAQLEELAQKVNEVVEAVNSLGGRGRPEQRKLTMAECAEHMTSMVRRVLEGPFAFAAKEYNSNAPEETKAVGDALTTLTVALGKYKEKAATVGL